MFPASASAGRSIPASAMIERAHGPPVVRWQWSSTSQSVGFRYREGFLVQQLAPPQPCLRAVSQQRAPPPQPPLLALPANPPVPGQLTARRLTSPRRTGSQPCSRMSMSSMPQSGRPGPRGSRSSPQRNRCAGATGAWSQSGAESGRCAGHERSGGVTERQKDRNAQV